MTDHNTDETVPTTRRREIVLINKGEDKAPTFWEKAERAAKIVSLVGIPAVVALFGWIIQQSLADKTVNKNYVQIAVSILSDPETASDSGLREWAVELLNKTSPTKFSASAAEELKTGTASLPRSPMNDAIVHSTLADSYLTSGDFERALEHSQRSLEMKRRILGDDNPEIAVAFANLRMLHRSLGDFEKANSALTHSLAIYEDQLGDGHPQYAIACSNLAILRLETGELNDAKNLFEKSLNIFESRNDELSSKATLVNLLRVYDSLDDKDSADRIRTKLNKLIESPNEK